MKKDCEDCGCHLESGICSNCQEELFILTFQAEDMPEGFSREFQERAEEQQELLKERKKTY